jgi:hypothetical protein
MVVAVEPPLHGVPHLAEKQSSGCIGSHLRTSTSRRIGLPTRPDEGRGFPTCDVFVRRAATGKGHGRPMSSTAIATEQAVRVDPREGDG